MRTQITDFILDSVLKEGSKASASKLVAFNLMMLNTGTTIAYVWSAVSTSNWEYLTSVLVTQILGALVAIGVVAASHLTEIKQTKKNDTNSAE
jgi:hypothetical protein